MLYISGETVPTTPRAPPRSMGTFYRGEIVRVCTRYTFTHTAEPRYVYIAPRARVVVDCNRRNVEFDAALNEKKNEPHLDI